MPVTAMTLDEIMAATDSYATTVNPVTGEIIEQADQLTEIIDYQAEPTAIKFHASKARVRGIMGPIGSGKKRDVCG